MTCTPLEWQCVSFVGDDRDAADRADDADAFADADDDDNDDDDDDGDVSVAGASSSAPPASAWLRCAPETFRKACFPALELPLVPFRDVLLNGSTADEAPEEDPTTDDTTAKCPLLAWLRAQHKTWPPLLARILGIT